MCLEALGGPYPACASVTTEPHHYEKQGHYLFVAPLAGDKRLSLPFETDGKVVTSFRSGLKEAVGPSPDRDSRFDRSPRIVGGAMSLSQAA